MFKSKNFIDYCMWLFDSGFRIYLLNEVKEAIYVVLK